MKQVMKLIIDTDPGVDDTNALVYLLNDKSFDIKLISVANGNIGLKIATRNMCHLLDLFEKDIPVVTGYEKRLGENHEDAAFLHGKQGLGGYTPPKNTITQPIKKDCADAMYDVLKEYPKQITLVILGPHTNVAYLFKKHPDSINLIKDVLMMGGSINGILSNPNHNSFNIRTDAPAFQETINAQLQVLMCPSRIGRDEGYFTEEMVEKIKNTNEVGEFLVKTFETYWEPNYPDKRISTNDVSAVYYLTHPKLYKTKKALVQVDTQNNIGKTTAVFTKKGNFKIVTKIKRKKFLDMLFKKLEELNDVSLNSRIKKLKQFDKQQQEKKKTVAKKS